MKIHPLGRPHGWISLALALSVLFPAGGCGRNAPDEPCPTCSLTVGRPLTSPRGGAESTYTYELTVAIRDDWPEGWPDGDCVRSFSLSVPYKTGTGRASMNRTFVRDLCKGESEGPITVLARSTRELNLSAATFSFKDRKGNTYTNDLDPATR